MPALVVWERLVVAGDDLRLLAVLTFLLRLLQIAMVSFIAYHIIQFDHKPEVFVLTECLDTEDTYWRWFYASVAGCFFTMTYGVIGAMIEVATYVVSGRGTPAETEARHLLVPLCKCNMVPMFIVRTIGFVFALVSLSVTERFCSCAWNGIPELYGVTLDDMGYRRGRVSACPIDTRAWYVAVRVLIFTMACDAFFPALTLIVVLRKRIHRAVRRVRPKKERDIEDVQRSWQRKCQRCCECSSLLTCYMCGGQKLTAGSYADVAIALTDFLDAGGSLDIVPSDVAAALICLVNVQKQKQLECKNELLKKGGLFAKDRTAATRLWKQFVGLNPAIPLPNLPNQKKKQETMRGISGSLRNSLRHSLSTSLSTSDHGDVETGGLALQNGGETSFMEAVLDEPVSAHNNNVSLKEEEGEVQQSAPHSFNEPTDLELEQLRQMILMRKQTATPLDFRVSYASGAMAFEPTITTVLSPQNSFDCLVLGEGSRYCAVALAAYSWMLFVWSNKCTGCCELTANSIYEAATCHPQCSCCHSSDNIDGSDMCGWKKATVLRSLGIEDSDILYANFSNDVGVNPYLVLRDRDWKTIVVTIRGTLSFEDMVSDVTITPISLEDAGNEFGFDGSCEFCHSGMFSGAKWIQEDLKRHGILEQAMKAHPDFGLRIVGHSLGAGVAAMLGRLLRQQYPKLHCLCFSPPGCVFTERTAKESRAYVTSYVLHNDIIPRLSYRSLVNLRNDLVEMVARIKVPKHNIFTANVLPWKEKTLEDLPERLLYNKDDVPESRFLTEFEEFKTKQTSRANENEFAHVRMTLPGRILHLLRTSESLGNRPCSCCLCCCPTTGKKYKVRWIESADLDEIRIAPTMMMDHFPYNVSRALDVAAESYGLADQSADHDSERLERILEEGAKKDC